MDPVETVDLLDGLVARSMVVSDRHRRTARYSLLETLRLFAEQALDGREDSRPTRQRHAERMLAVAQAARRQMSSRDTEAAMVTFDDEWENLRVALDWFASNGDVERALRLVVACLWYASATCRTELLAWAERVTAVPDATAHDSWPAAAGAISVLRRAIGDFEGGEAIARAALDVEQRRPGPDRFEPTYGLLLCTARRDSKLARRLVPALEQLAERSADAIELSYARYVRVVSGINAGVDGVLPYARQAATEAEISGNPIQLAFGYAGVLAALSRHDPAAAAEMLPTVRHWAGVARHRTIADNAALWLSAAPTATPTDVLVFTRDAIMSAVQHGQFGTLDLSLGFILDALIDLGRFAPAARILGGMRELGRRDPLRPHLVDEAADAVTAALGGDAAALLEDGRRQTLRALAEMALEQIDLALEPSRP
jgi:hypothetical protein